jgi:hypothetical protein
MSTHKAAGPASCAKKRLIAHCGGEDEITEPRRLAARRASTLEAELVEIEVKIATARAEGKEPEQSLVEYYGRLSARQRRHVETLGVERKARDLGSITEIVRRHAEQEAKARTEGGTDAEELP